ncbi:glutathione-disulfide reductase [Notoacmeibacter sp. MSK16QG-6]|uniref:glutathione-disulfide reductase n=1 Tax=Notoacmeibacter sp. MSK16QG-6 TaxID=2957982 RepID=UPI00209F3325|nr:glutathione-disulfide reductase [Notoacmeibacter sp. MSK16QG-6]MCP1199471.1 glutathione-disulfide reductase [Notoacmeibacter sp. MSK16QG-6]
MPRYDYDLFVIGGGSGGVRAARLAAKLGKKVAIAEEYRLGGTCVIRGCVPKKLFVYASQFHEHFEDAVGYGWTVGETSFDWPTLIKNKDAEIDRLESLYSKGLENAGADIFCGRAVLEDAHTLRLSCQDMVVTADQIVIATGSKPSEHIALPGFDLAIDSNDAFHLEELPKSILIYGGGYIAVEFANIFHGLGVETTLLYRGVEILGRFDKDVRRGLHDAMSRKGIRIITRDNLRKLEKRDDGRIDACLHNADEALPFDKVMMAIGRSPNTDGLGLEAAGVESDQKGAVCVDKLSRTNVKNIWALGDVTDRVQLTPVAIHEAMCLIQTLYHDNPTEPDYGCIPTAVFSQPEIGTVGLSEDDACEQYENIEIYKATFRPMRNTLAKRDERMLIKLVVDGDSRRVVGCHILGPDAGEMAQILGIAVKAQLTKDAFDSTMALHPSAAEELVTMYEPSYRVKNGERVTE